MQKHPEKQENSQRGSRLLRRSGPLGVLVAIAVCVGAMAASSKPAAAFVPSITAQCSTNVIDLTTPSAGQTHTYLKVWRWTGSSWQTIHTEMQKNVSSQYVVLDVFRPVRLPSGYVTARMYGWYPGTGWILLDTPHFRNGAGPLGTPYCRV